MKIDILFLIKLALSFLPFVLFAFLNSKANTKKEVRNRQYAMPVIAVVYSVAALIFLDQLSSVFMKAFLLLAGVFDQIRLNIVGNFIRSLYASWGIYLSLVLFNTAALLLYVIIKRFITLALGKIKIRRHTVIGSIVGLFYEYDELTNAWYIKEHYGQARTYIKTIYYGSCFISGLALLLSCGLCMRRLISAPFYPVFAVIIIGEMAFFIDGLAKEEQDSSLTMQADRSKHIAMYPLLRKPLKALFGDKLSAEGTTVNNGGISGGAIDDILHDLEKNGGHIGENYAAFIRKKSADGLKPSVDYVRCGYDLAIGKSLLFNTPFYDKLNPYVFYAMHRELLKGGKILIVLGRHGTEEDLRQWSEVGMRAVSNIPDLWNISILSGEKVNDDDLPDIGIISRSGVHDLDIHKNSLSFLRKVSFVFIVEPSRLVTTTQIGLNLLIKCCGQERAITFCSVDRNCDGLVDALSHILMTNITEVSATEYPHGMSSYMYWTADNDYLQHRILPGVSRYLGMGTELSLVALKNQIKKTVWYGGDIFPVQDARWIANQYYYDLLDYANLPTNQETFYKCFCTSFNMCDQRVSDYSYITVEDDRNNLFETRRNFATIAEQQGFVNVISTEYMLREYMSSNTELFTVDAKAIPYITADYARTKRNTILSLCLLLCIDSVQEEILNRQMIMLGIDTKDPLTEIWQEVCVIFGETTSTDKHGNPILTVTNHDGKTICFEKEKTILFKRAYSVESGKFESVYTIENADFSRLILDDLQNASYIAEKESKDVYIGTELKGHVYQKYMPGQFFTLSGKYYEMISTTTDNRILVRRASEHIGARLSYRQVRNYTIHRTEDCASMGTQKTVNNIGIHYQYADFCVETPGYWKLRAYNDFDNGDLVKVNGVPMREYRHKQILKFDFSALGDAFTDSVRMTLTNLLNESFVTLFADNQPFISAITPGSYDAPLTYSLALGEDVETSNQCIFIVEDSQLDIGLLIAVERNISRIFQIISDYLSWNEEQIEESLPKPPSADADTASSDADTATDGKPEKKLGFFGKIGAWFNGLFKKKDKKGKTDKEDDKENTDGKPKKKRGFFSRIGAWFKGLFKKKEKPPKETEQPNNEEETPSSEETGAQTETTASPETENGVTAEAPTDFKPETTDEVAETAPEVTTAENGDSSTETTAEEEEPSAEAPQKEDESSTEAPQEDGDSSTEAQSEPTKPLSFWQKRKAAKEAAKAEKQAQKLQQKAEKEAKKLLKKQKKSDIATETAEAVGVSSENADANDETLSQNTASEADVQDSTAQSQAENEVEVNEDE